MADSKLEKKEAASNASPDSEINESIPTVPWYFHLLAVLIIGCLVFYGFKDTLTHEFTFDDHLAIEGNGDLDLRMPYPQLWLHDIWGKDLIQFDSHKSYRPLLITIFRWIWNSTYRSPMTYRVASIFAHFIVSILVYRVGLLIFVNEYILALTSACLFAVHPIHVEAITAVVNLAEPLSAICILFGYYLVRTSLFPLHNEKISSFSIIIRIIGVLFFAILGTLIKETGSILGLLCLGIGGIRLVHEFFYHPQYNWSVVSLIKPRQCHLWIVLGLGLVIFYLFFRSVIVSTDRLQILSNPTLFVQELYKYLTFVRTDSYLNNSELIRRAENPFAKLSGWTKIMSLSHLYSLYLIKMIYPLVQSPEYSFNCISSVEYFSDPRNYYSLFMYVMFVCLLITGLFRLIFIKSTKLSIGLIEILMIFVVAFFPATGIVYTLGTLLAERLMYLPSLPMIYMMVWIVSTLLQGLFAFCQRFIPWKLIWLSLMMVTTALYMNQLIEYNQIWSNDASLFLHCVKVCPTSAKANLQVAKLYSNQHKYRLSYQYLAQSKAIDPDFCDTGYQDAYLLIAEAKYNATQPYDAESMNYDTNTLIDTAVGYAINNLNCSFTAGQSLTLLNQLWEFQLTSTTSKSRDQIYYTQAKLAQKHGLMLEAIKKYIEASVLAFEQEQVITAIQRIDRAYKLIPLINPSGENTLESTSMQLLSCKIYSFSGTYRSVLYEKYTQKQVSIKKKTLSSLNLTIPIIEQYLEQATNKTCLQYLSAVPMISQIIGLANRHYLVMLNHQKEIIQRDTLKMYQYVSQLFLLYLLENKQNTVQSQKQLETSFGISLTTMKEQLQQYFYSQIQQFNLRHEESKASIAMMLFHVLGLTSSFDELYGWYVDVFPILLPTLLRPRLKERASKTSKTQDMIEHESQENNHKKELQKKLFGYLQKLCLNNNQNQNKNQFILCHQIKDETYFEF